MHFKQIRLRSSSTRFKTMPAMYILNSASLRFGFAQILLRSDSASLRFGFVEHDAAQHARQFSFAQIQLWTTQSMFENSVRDT